jgi:TonB family protein
MNRLQKKCLIATAGFHLLLVLTIVFGAAFFTSHSKPDETQLLDVIPANLVDAAVSSGVKNAQPPAPTPPQPPQPVQPPQPPQPQPKPEPVKPPDPEPVKPTPSLVQKVEKFFEPEPKKLSPEALEPVEKPAKPKPKKKEISLTTVVRKVPTVSHDTSEADARAAAKEAREAKKRAAAAFANAAQAIKENASSSTEIEMPDTGSVSYANYASAVKTIYEQAWTPPDDTASDDAITKVSVTIARDGSVTASRILNRSGDSKVDASVQRTLDNVNFVAPFPDGAKEKEKTFIINFNLKAKRMLG